MREGKRGLEKPGKKEEKRVKAEGSGKETKMEDLDLVK